MSRCSVAAGLRPNRRATIPAISQSPQIALTDARLGGGWQAVEPGWRWTSGEAALDLRGVRVLDVEVAITMCYWLTDGDAEERVA